MGGLAKEIKAVEEKLEVVTRFKDTVQVIVDLVNSLTAFDNSLKAIDNWKDAATAELKDIKEASGAMLPEDRVARTMDLQEDIAAKLECDKYSNDVKFWAEYRAGIKEFSPWLASAEKSATEGLSKPSDLSEVQALNEKVLAFDKTCVNYLKVLTAAEGASLKMTTHTEADTEVAALKERYAKV